ncbi:MAG: adenylate cyclase regulatory domain-containing protein [Solirubrobacteraceae bacterium]
MDFVAEGLLDGLEGDERAARERLLETLLDGGIDLAELRSAVAEDRLALLPVERVLGGRYTAREIEQRTGVHAPLLLRIRRLQGLPEAGEDDRVFGDEDVEAAQSTRLFLETGLGEKAISEMTRVLGEAMARIAATTAATFVDAFLKPGDSEEEVAIRFAELAESLTPALGPVFMATFKAHLRESVRRGMLGRTERETGHISGEQEVAVCFADLVGFTRLGGEVDVEELGNVAGRLAELAGDVAREPVRLVKTIGDAAMFVSPDPGALVGVALELVAAVEAAELPTLRAGVAHGGALQRAGDFFGHSVNLASRVTGIARAGSVLCTQEVRDAAPESYEWSFAGKHRLKGLPEPVPLHRARPKQPETEDPPSAESEPGPAEAKQRRGDRRQKRAAS